MNALKIACLTVFLWLRQAWLYPVAVVNALKQRRLDSVDQEDELERLDRLRHPYKYRGR
jgi:hypothetical protein